jgi:hypothetical protein
MRYWGGYNKNVLKLSVVMVAHIYENTKNLSVIHFK